MRHHPSWRVFSRVYVFGFTLHMIVGVVSVRHCKIAQVRPASQPASYDLCWSSSCSMRATLPGYNLGFCKKKSHLYRFPLSSSTPAHSVLFSWLLAKPVRNHVRIQPFSSGNLLASVSLAMPSPNWRRCRLWLGSWLAH